MSFGVQITATNIQQRIRYTATYDFEAVGLVAPLCTQFIELVFNDFINAFELA